MLSFIYQIHARKKPGKWMTFVRFKTNTRSACWLLATLCWEHLRYENSHLFFCVVREHTRMNKTWWVVCLYIHVPYTHALKCIAHAKRTEEAIAGFRTGPLAVCSHMQLCHFFQHTLAHTLARTYSHTHIYMYMHTHTHSHPLACAHITHAV